MERHILTETDIQNLRKSVKEEIGTAKNELDGVINKMKGYGYKFIAEAALDTDPGTPSENIFYICTTPGEYINFPTNMFSGQHETVYFTLGEGEVGLLLYTIPDDMPTISNWSLVKLDLAKGSTVKDIEKQISNISASVKKLDKSVAPRLFFNGNALVGVDSLSLDKFLVLKDFRICKNYFCAFFNLPEVFFPFFFCLTTAENNAFDSPFVHSSFLV